MTNIYEKYRPTSLKEIIGNESLKRDIRPFLKGRRELPASILLTGPSGCGKTTIARIIGEYITGNCASDLHELDTADFRGIDAVRDIRRQMQLHPLGGSARCWILDECFHQDTLISTVKGQVKISDIKQGDLVYSALGLDTVKHIFKNKVALNDICILTLQNHTFLLCSSKHEFFTNHGWKQAKDITSQDLLYDLGSLNENKISKNLYGLWNFISSKIRPCFNMKQEMQEQKKQQKNQNNLQSLPFLWNAFFGTGEQADLLFSQLQQETVGGTEQWNNTIFTLSPGASKNKEKLFAVSPNRKRQKNSSQFQFAYATRQSCFKSFGNGSYYRNEEIKRDECNKKPRWQWLLDQTSSMVIPSIIAKSNSMFFRASYFFRQAQGKLSYLLQGRFSNSSAQIGNRSGWEKSQHQKTKTVRFKKRKGIECIRVESCTFYKSENINRFRKCGLTDKDIARGFVEFYDLEMSKHHSYIANDVLVHNCHMLTNEAQNALLKALEKPPSKVYFLLCTTDPQKLLKTIQTRCVHFEVEALQISDLIEMMKSICVQEKVKVPVDILKNIAKQSNCSGRLALTHLDRVLARKPEDYDKVLDSIENFEIQVKDLCQALLSRKSWKTIAKLLSGLKEEPEKIRRACLSYMNSVLLSGQANTQAALIIEYFSQAFYDSGAAGLSLACFYCVNIEEE